jgi:ribosomal protein L11
MPDLNAIDMAGAMKIVDGTARASWITTDIHEMTADEIRAKLA